MTTFEKILDEIFTRSVESPDLTVEEERQLISDAQFGDEEATLTIIRAYGDLLRGQVRRHEARLGRDDARSITVSGLLEALHAFNPQEFSGRLVEIAVNFVRNALGEEPDARDAITVPPRTRRRFFAILHKAGGDHGVAESTAPGLGMTAEVYRAVRAAVSFSYPLNHTEDQEVGGSGTHSERTHSSSRRIDALASLQIEAAAHREDTFASVEDRYLADSALSAIAGPEHTVSRYAYGFATGEGMSDGEVAETWSLDELGREKVAAGQYVASRAKVQRIRTSALGKMRDALGVA